MLSSIRCTHFNQKLVLITGGSSGIGLALAHTLARRGANLCLLARDPQKLAAVAQTLRLLTPTLTLCADVGDPDTLSKALNQLPAPPDLLINAAGIVEPGVFEQLDLNDFERMMRVNYFGTLYTIRNVLPGMIARGSGYIVNISSLAAVIGIFGYAAYAPSKFAVRALSDVLRVELAMQGIGISLVLPPDTDTPQLAYENTRKPPQTKQITGHAGLLTAHQVADEIVRGIERGRYLILPGKLNQLMYRCLPLLGDTAFDLMLRMLTEQ